MAKLWSEVRTCQGHGHGDGEEEPDSRMLVRFPTPLDSPSSAHKMSAGENRDVRILPPPLLSRQVK